MFDSGCLTLGVCLDPDDQETQDLLQPLVDPSGTKPLVNGSLEPDRDAKEDGEKDGGQGLQMKQSGEECKEEKAEQEEKRRQKKKYTRLSHLRRRRCGRKDVHAEDESDLSEGFESDEEEEEEEDEDGGGGGGRSSVEPVEPAVNSSSSSSSKKEVKRDEVSWATGSEEEEEEEEEGGTAFDVETDSDMNSQESRSDLEDIEEAESSELPEGRPRQQGQRSDEEGDGPEEQRRKEGGGGGDTPPATNGPLLPGNDASIISSNLQAMSSQLFQAKRSFRLAPTFSNMLLRPPGSGAATSPAPAPTATTTASPTPENPPPAGDTPPSDVTPHTVNGINEIGKPTIVLSVLEL